MRGRNATREKEKLDTSNKRPGRRGKPRGNENIREVRRLGIHRNIFLSRGFQRSAEETEERTDLQRRARTEEMKKMGGKKACRKKDLDRHDPEGGGNSCEV